MKGLSVHLSKHQEKILGYLAVQPNMTTKDLAEMVFGKTVGYKTKEFSSIYRSLVSLEKKGLIKRIRVQLTWQRTTK